MLSRPPRARSYWRATLRLTAALLALWVGVTFGLGYFARELSFSFFGWPFSFWVASQGAPLVYGLIVAVYALCMRRLDDACADEAIAQEQEGQVARPSEPPMGF